MKSLEIMMIVFGATIAIISLVVLMLNVRKRTKQRLGLFDEVLPNGQIKFSSTTLFSFLSLLFLFMGNMVLLGVIVEDKSDANWNFLMYMLIFNITFLTAAFVPKRLKQIDFAKLFDSFQPRKDEQDT